MAKVVKEVPAGVRGKVDWHEVDQTARDNPGEWVEVEEPLSSGVASALRRGDFAHIDPEVYKVTLRAHPEYADSKVIYVKFVGDDDDD